VLTDPLLWQMLAMLVAVGGFAGVVAGMLGVGGGIVLVPAFFYVFRTLGHDGPQIMQVCVATSLATIIVTSVRSVVAHNRRGAVDWVVLRRWGPWLVVGAVAGTAAAAVVSSAALQAVFGVMGMVAGLWMAFGRDHWRLGPGLPGAGTQGGIAGGVGFLSVLMGIGGGTFGVPLLTAYSMPIHRAVATAAGFGIAIAVPAVAGFLFITVADAPPLTVGAVNLPAFAAVIGTTLLTTPLGVALAHRMDARPLKRAFAVFLVAVAANMLRKVVWG
jgi:uncharacterized membrane protein YfcA